MEVRKQPRRESGDLMGRAGGLCLAFWDAERIGGVLWSSLRPRRVLRAETGSNPSRRANLIKLIPCVRSRLTSS